MYRALPGVVRLLLEHAVEHEDEQPLQRVEHGEQVVEHDAGLVDGEDGEHVGQAEQDDDDDCAMQLGADLRLRRLVELHPPGHTDDLPQDEDEGDAVHQQDERHGAEKREVEHWVPDPTSGT